MEVSNYEGSVEVGEQVFVACLNGASRSPSPHFGT